MTEGHDRRHNVTARDVENVAHAGLVARRDGRHDAAQPTGSCRQQDVPDEWIDGRPAGDLVPIQVAIGGGECREVRAYDEHDWYLVERLGEAVRLGRRNGRVSMRRGGGSVFVARQWGKRNESRQHVRDVVVPSIQVEVTERAPTERILDDDHVPGLAIAARGREARVVEYCVKDFVAHGFVEEGANGAGRAKRVSQFHEVTLGLRYWFDPASLRWKRTNAIARVATT